MAFRLPNCILYTAGSAGLRDRGARPSPWCGLRMEFLSGHHLPRVHPRPRLKTELPRARAGRRGPPLGGASACLGGASACGPPLGGASICICMSENPHRRGWQRWRRYERGAFAVASLRAVAVNKAPRSCWRRWRRWAVTKEELASASRGASVICGALMLEREVARRAYECGAASRGARRKHRRHTQCLRRLPPWASL